MCGATVCPMETQPPPRLLRGIELRYVLTRILQISGPCTVRHLIDVLQGWNFTVAGRPSKAVSDALRWEMGRERVWRIGRGRYKYDEAPRGTEYRIVARVFALREEADPSCRSEAGT